MSINLYPALHPTDREKIIEYYEDLILGNSRKRKFKNDIDKLIKIEGKLLWFNEKYFSKEDLQDFAELGSHHLSLSFWRYGMWLKNGKRWLKERKRLNKDEIKLEIESVEEKLKMMTSRIEILAFECMPDPQISLLFKTGYFEKEHRTSKVYVEEVNGKDSLEIMLSKGVDSYEEAGIPFEEFVANPFFTIKGGDAGMYINVLKERLQD